MCVEMDDVQVRIAFCNRAHSAQCDQMFAANQKRSLTGLQDFVGLRFNIGKRLFCAAEAQL